MRTLLLLLVCTWGTPVRVRAEDSGILPTPKDFQRTAGVIRISETTPVEFLAPSKVSETVDVAVDLIRKALRGRNPGIELRRFDLARKHSRGAVQIILSSYADWVRLGEPEQGDVLNSSERQLLGAPGVTGQEHILWVDPDPGRVYLIGASDQGVLYAAVSFVQLLKGDTATIRIEGCQIRDFPDFEYRLAADWLMNVEIDRWSYDWGDGVSGYLNRIKRKLDLCLDHKINMVLFHGFGWGTDLFPGFGSLFRELNHYARQRGIHLVTGGYGASYGMSYQSGPLYEEAPYLGKLFMNRDSYPDGKVYECMGFSYSREGGMNPSTTGSCRANDELNRLKAAELREYVEKTEPGGILIHHEDFGGFEGTQGAWLQRCDRCRARWPNDDLKALDGGAGGLAHGYRQFVETVGSVRNLETGYDGSRDCIIFLVSPVYGTDSTSAQDWDNVLELWKNIAQLLPSSKNIQIAFRETYPLQGTTRRFVDDFNRVMQEIDKPFRVFMVFVGGANYFYNDYPVVSSPALNASFLGAGTIYNGGSGFNQEPMQLIEAEYSWNVRSTGFYRDPKSYESAHRIRLDLQDNRVWPQEIWGSDGLLETACVRLYGPKAAPAMVRFNALHEEASEDETPPRMWTKLYPLTSMWRNLALDSNSWPLQITQSRLVQFMKEHNLTAPDLHERLTSRWIKWGRVTGEGQRLVEAALRATRSDQPSRGDLEHLLTMLQVGGRFASLLADFHTFLRTPPGDPKAALGKTVLNQAETLESFIQTRLGAETLHPAGGERGASLRALSKIRQTVSPGD